jgi:hypothetical protein
MFNLTLSSSSVISTDFNLEKVDFTSAFFFLPAGDYDY